MSRRRPEPPSPTLFDLTSDGGWSISTDLATASAPRPRASTVLEVAAADWVRLTSAGRWGNVVDAGVDTLAVVDHTGRTRTATRDQVVQVMTAAEVAAMPFGDRLALRYTGRVFAPAPPSTDVPALEVAVGDLVRAAAHDTWSVVTRVGARDLTVLPRAHLEDETGKVAPAFRAAPRPRMELGQIAEHRDGAALASLPAAESAQAGVDRALVWASGRMRAVEAGQPVTAARLELSHTPAGGLRADVVVDGDELRRVQAALSQQQAGWEFRGTRWVATRTMGRRFDHPIVQARALLLAAALTAAGHALVDPAGIIGDPAATPETVHVGDVVTLLDEAPDTGWTVTRVGEGGLDATHPTTGGSRTVTWAQVIPTKNPDPVAGGALDAALAEAGRTSTTGPREPAAPSSSVTAGLPADVAAAVTNLGLSPAQAAQTTAWLHAPADGVDEFAVAAGVTGAQERLFTMDACRVLADAVAERTGWPVVVVADSGPVGWVHAGVRAPDGRVLDVCGLHDPDTWLASWAETVDAFGRDHDDYDGDTVQIRPATDFPDPSVPDAETVATAAGLADRFVAALAERGLLEVPVVDRIGRTPGGHTYLESANRAVPGVPTVPRLPSPVPRPLAGPAPAAPSPAPYGPGR